MTKTDEKPRALNLNFETVGLLVAMLVGACALFVAWDQAQIMRKQQHASVPPVVNTRYCSVFNRCWRNTRDNSARPTRMKKGNDGDKDIVARMLQGMSAQISESDAL